MEDFKIKIPKEYKEKLELRFSYENRKIEQETVYIPHSCPLCKAYKPHCFLCPVYEWASNCGMEHCSDILEDLLCEKPAFRVTSEVVKWSLNDNSKVKEQLERLRTNAEAIIEWV